MNAGYWIIAISLGILVSLFVYVALTYDRTEHRYICYQQVDKSVTCEEEVFG